MTRLATTLFALALLLAVPQMGQAQPTLDGQVTSGEPYQKLGEWTQNDTGFGDHGMLTLYGYQDGNNLYLAIVGEAEDNGNAFLTFFDVSSQTDGVNAGNSLPETTDGLSPLNGYGTTDGGATHDFQTDFGIRISSNNDGGTDAAFASIVDYTNINSSGNAEETFLQGSLTDGRFPADGSEVTFDDAPFAGTRIAYDDVDLLSNVTNEAVEFAIPLSALGASSGDTYQVFSLYTGGGGGTISANTLPEIAGQSGSNLGSPGNVDFSSSNFPADQHSSPSPLPVELTSFTARRDGQSAVLSWTTASETNNAGFAVQHATGESADFEEIGYRESKAQGGTTSQAITYRFTADDLSPGTHRFRLQQEDLDGSTSLSKVKTVEVRPSGAVAMEGVTPHPVTGPATFRFGVKERQPVTVTLFDVMGRRVKTLHQGPVTPGGMTTVDIPGGLSSGLYLVRVEGQTFQRTQRITVVE